MGIIAAISMPTSASPNTCLYTAIFCDSIMLLMQNHFRYYSPQLVTATAFAATTVGVCNK